MTVRVRKSSLLVVFAAIFAFACFFPNPALPLGSNTGLQVSHVLALATLPALFALGLPRRQALALALLVGPLMVSMLALLLTGRAISGGVALNAFVASVLALGVLLPSGWLARSRCLAATLAGAAVAIIVHAFVGGVQFVAFSRDSFPLRALYQNPAFGDKTNFAEEWSTYVKRPFGLFPEPSAMSSSIGPWMILIVVLLLYPGVRGAMGRGLRWLLPVAVASGFALLVISKSGYVVPMMVCLVVAALPRISGFFRERHRPVVILGFGVLMLAGIVGAMLALINLSPRLDFASNSSWIARSASLVWGLEYLIGNPLDFIFGIGPGQSYLMLQSIVVSGAATPNSSELAVTAVWSMLILYMQETGLFGILALFAVLGLVLRAIFKSSMPLLGLGCFLAWLTGVTLTTSYLPLSPIWLFFAFLLSWDRVFPKARTDPETLANFVKASPDSESETRVGAKTVGAS